VIERRWKPIMAPCGVELHSSMKKLFSQERTFKYVVFCIFQHQGAVFERIPLTLLAHAVFLSVIAALLQGVWNPTLPPPYSALQRDYYRLNPPTCPVPALIVQQHTLRQLCYITLTQQAQLLL